MRRSVLVLLSVLAALPGCSTLRDDTFQVVEVVTPGVIGADCTLKTHDNFFRVTTPGKVQVQRSPESLEIECRKAHYYPVLMSVKPKNYVVHSAILNSVDGIVPGTAYDVASNAIYRYPGTISVEMEPDPAAIAATAYPVEPSSEPLLKKKTAEPEMKEAEPEAMPSAQSMRKALRK